MDHRPRHSPFGTLVKIGIALFFWREITVLLVVGLLLVGPFLAGAIMGSVIGGVVSGDAMNPPGAFMLVGGLLTTVAVWAWVLFSGAIICDRTDREQVAAFKDALERTLATLTHTLSPQWEARRFPPQGQVNGPSGQFLACRAPKGDTGITVYVRVDESGRATCGHYFSNGEHCELGHVQFASFTDAVAQIASWLDLPCAGGRRDGP